MVSFFKFLSARRSATVRPKPQLAPVSSGAAFQFEGIPFPAPSQLLKEVLPEEHAPEHSPEEIKSNKAAIQPLSQRLNVGSRLADAKQRLIEAASRIGELLDRETASTIGAIVQDLENRVCRIAVVGQMNAGKSSLINVLVEQSELLPADINPWTTVITNLHFGVPGAPTSGASFTFFTLEEWQRLSVGGRTRELTEHIFPDFDWEALNKQVEIMQKRAEQRLGPRFKDLLGTEHAYSALTPGLLDRYVGAGHPTPEDQAKEGAEGEFSDITKVANVFFDLGAFNFPTILIDTPGVNDPFLVRDEITRQSLQAADICVILVTARHPLSTADLGLLRVLRGLNKNRLVIFVNKIDEIEGGEELQRELTQRISVILEQEFPGARIPIVFGSALWARRALFPAASEGASAIDDDAAHGLYEASAAYDWIDQAEISDAVTAETFLRKSGLPSLALAISEMMSSGTVAEAIDSANGLIQAAAQNHIACFEAEISILAKCLTDLEAARKEASALKKLQDSAAAEFEAFSEKLAQIYNQRVTEVYQELISTVKGTLNDILSALPENATIGQISQIDPRLRVKLEAAFGSAFDAAAKSVLAEHKQLQAKLSELFAASGLAFDPAAGSKCVFGATPSLAALGEPAAVGLSAIFEAFSPKRFTVQERDRELSNIITSDFEPIVVKLADEAGAALNKLSLQLMQQMRTLTLLPIHNAAERVAKGLADRERGDRNLDRELEARRESVSKLRLILSSNASVVPTS